MKKLILNVFNEGLSAEELNSLRGGIATPLCTCNGGTYDCGCYQDCTCNGEGSKLICSCNGTKLNTGIGDHPVCPDKK